MIAQLKKHFDHLESSREQFLSGISQYDSTQLAFSLRPDAWSLLQIAEHIVLVEEGLLVGRAFDKTRGEHRGRRLRYALRRLIVGFIFKLGLRVPMPVTGIGPGSLSSLPEIAAGWGTLRRGLETQLGQMSRSEASRPLVHHPVLGPLNAVATLRFLQRHFNHHRRQAARLAAQENFPAGQGTGAAQTRSLL